MLKKLAPYTRGYRWYILLGVLCGGMSYYFTTVNSRIGAFYKRLPSQGRKWLYAGITLGVLLFVFPPLYGEGYEGFTSLMHGDTRSLFNTSLFYRFSDIDWVVILFIIATMFFKVIAMASTNAAGGVAPILDMVRDGIQVGLGTDMAGGYTLSLLRTITDAIQASKLRWVYTERNGEPFAKKRFMTIANAFYLATKGGGAFFGKVGSFEPDYEFDAVVLDDAPLADFVERPLPDRLQRILWCHTPETVTAKFIQGKQVYQA